MSEIYLEEINYLKSYIDVHYSEPLNLARMAKVAHMNLYYFSAFFKKMTGENFKTYLTDIRMKEAKRLVLSTDLKTYEIAERIGYSSVRLFSDKFLETYGERPMELKRLTKEAVDTSEILYREVI